MTITTKGSGGQIRFSGTGGALRIPGSGGGGGGGGGGPSSPVTITPYISGVAQAPLACVEGSIVTFREPDFPYTTAPYGAVMDSTAVNKNWATFGADYVSGNWVLPAGTDVNQPELYAIQLGDTTGNYGEPMPEDLGSHDWQWGGEFSDYPNSETTWIDPGTGINWNVGYRIIVASGIQFVVRLLRSVV